MRTLLLALQLVAGVADADSTRTSAESRLLARVDVAANEFLNEWRNAWQDEERERSSRGGLRDYYTRQQALHCHFVETPGQIRKYLIRGRTRAHASCPRWYPGDDRRIVDERLDLDAAVGPERRPDIMAQRELLRALLDSAAVQLPKDMQIAMHRVRFALDARDLPGAANAARACGGPAAECGMLQGLVLYRMGRVAEADSTFQAATALMSEDERCRWNDVAPLLDRATRREYERMSCADRARFETRLWWLADPLYLEPANERRAEHAARKTTVRLLALLEHDGRQRWAPRKGGEAATEVLVRYGLPSHWFWGGLTEDLGHDTWLRQHGADITPPYGAREYTRGRLHTVPGRDALRSPFQASAHAWQLAEPAGEDDWWPEEHYARDAGGIAQLADGQLAVLRRRDGSRLVWAVDLDPASLARPAHTAVQATLFRSTAEGDVSKVVDASGNVGERLRVESLVPGGDALLGVEIAGDGAGNAAPPAARTRFGTTIPQPLRTLGAGRDVSSPLLIDAPADASLKLGADAAVARMYGTTSLAAGHQRLGVYWEGYGFRDTDTLDIEVEVLRETRPGVLKRVLGALRIIGRNDVGGIGVRWRETPGASRAITFDEGGVPVQARSVVLGIGSLPRGNYRMVVTMSGTDSTTAKGERNFTIR